MGHRSTVSAFKPIVNPGRAIAEGSVPPHVPLDNPRQANIDLIDVFCGCGGLSAGFRMVSGLTPSFRLAGAVDLDEDAIATYQANLGLAPLRADAHALISHGSSWGRLARYLDRRKKNLTVVVGGPPCQGFSSHRKTIDDCEDLNNLVPDFARIAVKLDADAVLMENVAELLTTRAWPYYLRATETLRDAGYTVRTRVYNFAGFGLPQERFRVLTLAMRRNFAMPAPFLQRGEYRTVRQAIGDLPATSPGADPPADDPDHVTAQHRASTVATIAAVPKNGGRRPLHLGPDCLRELASRNGRTGYDDVYGRLWWDRPSVTITGHSRNPASGRFSHPEQDRGLTVREAALLQGFPPSFRFSGTLMSRFLQVGNAVPPLVAAYLAGHILAELSSTRKELPDLDADVTKPVGTSFSRLIPGIKSGGLRL